MNCDRYFELLSARLDREVTKEEAEEVELHCVGCGHCRIVKAQMDELREGFAGLEDVEAPEGFAQGVMDRIRGEKKVIPLFKRPRFKAMAGMAACAALVIGLYGVVQPRKDAGEQNLQARSFHQEMLDEDMEAPDAVAYLDLDEPVGSAETVEGELYGRCQEKSVGAVSYDGAAAVGPEYSWFQNDQYLRVTYGDTPESGARIIGNGQSLEEFLARFPSDDLSEVRVRYNGDYFVSGRLLAAVVEEPSGSIRHRIAGLLREQVTIEQTSPYCTEDMAAWLILAEVDSTFHDGDELSVTVIPWEDDADS